MATPPTDSLAAVMYAISGGKYVLRLSDSNARPGSRSGDVLDSDGKVIGSASDCIYGGSGFAVHTRAFGGYVSNDQIVFHHEMMPPTAPEPAIMVAESSNPRYPWRQYFVITDERCVVVEMMPASLCGWKFHRVWVNPGDGWRGMTRDQIVEWKRAHSAPIAMAPDLGAFRGKLLAVAESGQIPERV